MPNFREKSIFIWNEFTIGDAAKITQLLVDAGFEGAYLHSTNVGNWRTSTRVQLAQALKAAGMAVYASVAVYGNIAETEGHAAASIVNQYQLDGVVFDVESGRYEEQAAGPGLVRNMFTAYQQMTAKPSAFCGWPFYHATNNTSNIFHPVAVLIEAMKYADVGMPMAYPGGNNNTIAALAYLNAVWAQWRKYTGKPLVIAGRACNDNSGTANAASIVPYAQRALELGTVGMSWWDMEHALKIPGVWQALALTPKFNQVSDPVEVNMWSDKPMLLVTADTSWTNTEFAGIVGYIGKNYGDPNSELAPIELKAAEMGMPYLVMYDFTMAYYTGNQQPMGDAHWPKYDLDYPLQMFCEGIRNRNIKAAIVRVMDEKDHTGTKGDAGWISYAAKMFMTKARIWMDEHGKAHVPLILASSNAFIRTFAPDMNGWAHLCPNWIDQRATVLDKSYPVATDKPWYLGASPTWEFWGYWPSPGKGIAIFNGTPEQFAAKYGGTAPEPPKPPVSEDYKTLLAMVNALTGTVTNLTQRLTTIEREQAEMLEWRNWRKEVDA